MSRSTVARKLRRLFAVPLLLVLASGPASAFGVLVVGVILFLAALLARTAFVSKYALMALILLNPCVREPCPTYSVAGLTLPAMPADPVVMALNIDLLEVFRDFYIVAILYYAVYVIFLSTSPSARAKAKNMLMNLLVGMVVVSQSRVILQLALNISQAVAYAIIDIAGQRLASLASLGIMARVEMCILDLLFVSLGMAAMLAAGARYFLILLMAAFFPLALFLYFIPFTKNYGIILIRFTALLILIQVIQALLYSVTIISAVDEAGLPGFIIAIGGLFGVVYSPLLGMKLMGWLGGITHFYSTRGGGAATRFSAMLMRGQPLGSAFQTAGAQYMIGHNMGPLMRGLTAAPFDAETPIAGAWGARAPAGYGLRSARSFGAISEGHSGAGVKLPAKTFGGGEPDGGYLYQKTPQAVVGSAITREDTEEKQRDFYRTRPRAASRLTETPSMGAAPAVGLTKPGAAGFKPGIVSGAPLSKTQGESPREGGFIPAGTTARAVKPLQEAAPGKTSAAAVGAKPVAAGEAAAAGHAMETQEKSVEEEGKLTVGRPTETTQKPAGLGAAKPAGIDEDKHKKEMAQLRVKREELLRQLKKAGADGESGVSMASGASETAGVRKAGAKVHLPGVEPSRETLEGPSDRNKAETAREPSRPEASPVDVRSLYEELNRKLNGMRGSGQDVREPDEMMREASVLMDDMKYDDAYRKLDNVRRLLGT